MPDESPAESSIPEKASPKAATQDNIPMDDDKIARIRSRINRIKDPELRKKARHVFIDKLFSGEKLEQFIAMLVLNETDDSIRDFINDNATFKEEFYQVTEEKQEVPKTKKRKVIYAEEARRAEQFQKEFQKILQFAGIIFGVLIALLFLFWQFIWIPSTSDSIYKKGLQMVKAGEFSKGEARFIEAQQRGGPSMLWYNRFALAYLDRNETLLAEKKYLKALEYNRDDKLTILNLAELYRHYPLKRYNKANEIYTVLKRKDKNDFQVIDKIGMNYVDWGLETRDTNYFGKAAVEYGEYLTEHKEHLPSIYRLLYLSILNKNEEVMDYLYKMIDTINPNSVDLEVLNPLLDYYITKRQMPKAKDMLEKCLKYMESNPLKRDNTTALKKKQEMEEKGISQHVESRPEDRMLYSDGYYQNARYLTFNLSFERALDSLSNALIFNSNNGKCFNLRGEIFMVLETNLQFLTRAKHDFENATNATPNDYRPYANLGHISYYYYMRYQQNVINLSQAEMMAPESSLSKALEMYKTARMKFQEQDLEPGSDFQLSYNLAWLYYHFENYENALREWADLYIKTPYDPILSYAMGSTYFHLQNFSIAKTQFEKAVDYYGNLAKNIGYLNPYAERHIDIYMQLAKSYNNRGVCSLYLASRFPNNRSFYEKEALLDFYRAKDASFRIKRVYENAEYNIKYLLNKDIKNRLPSFDENIPMRTTTQKLVEQFKKRLIQEL